MDPVHRTGLEVAGGEASHVGEAVIGRVFFVGIVFDYVDVPALVPVPACFQDTFVVGIEYWKACTGLETEAMFNNGWAYSESWLGP